MRLMSISTCGCASRSFIAGIRLWPPARSLASSLCLPSSERASSRLLAATYSNCVGIMVFSGHFTRAKALSLSSCNAGLKARSSTNCAKAHLRGPRLVLADNPPDSFRLDGHVEMAHSEGRERVNHAGHDGRRCADSTGLTNAFHAHGIHVRGRLRAVEFHPWNVAGARHGIIHERPADELSLVVINYFFKQRLPQRLHDAALHLSIYQHWIDDFAAVVDGDVALEVNLAGLAVNLHHGDVCAKRKGEILRLEEVRC